MVASLKLNAIWLVLVGVLISGNSFGAVTLIEKGETTIRVTQPTTGPTWPLGEEVCVIKNETIFTCGNVVESDESEAVVEVGSMAKDVDGGDRIQSYREIAGLYNVGMATLGLMAGVGYYFPHLHVQVRAGGKYHAGLMITMSSNEEQNNKISSTGIFGTLNYYDDLNPFRGFWWRVGAGAYLLNVQNVSGEESATAPAILSTVGWRGYFGRYLTVGASLGLQYLPDSISSAKLSLRNIEPLFTFDAGIRF